MDLQTGLIYIGVVVVSAAVILLVSMFGIKEKSYEEAIAEQRKLPDDLLTNKKEKNKEKKHRNKTGKKVKEKKEEKEERDDKEEKPDHVQFEETPHILPPESMPQENIKASKKKGKSEKVKPILVNKDEPSGVTSDLTVSQPPATEINHFDLIHPKDDLELVRSHSKDNLQQINQIEPTVIKTSKDTPIKTKKGMKDSGKKKDDIGKDSSGAVSSNVKEKVKEIKDQPKEAKEVKEVKEVTEIVKETAVPSQLTTNKESKKTKKKNDILNQIGGERDGVNVSLLMLLIQKSELSRSEIQVLIDQLLNKQQDNPLEHSEWTESRADPVIKLKKQLAEKEIALADEHEASVAFQNKLKELRAELNSEKSRLSSVIRQLEENLNSKVTEAQTLHTRMQHILESHAAEKQGFARQIEQLQSKINEDTAIIHKMQEDQGQTQGHMQQELIAQRKQMEVQFAQMRENENALKAQLAQKHLEVQELQNELQATCDNSSAEIDMLRQQLGMMQTQFMHSEGQLQHFKEAGDRLQDVVRQLEDSHRAQADLDHRLKSAHRHEQELQKQVNSLQMELNVAKADACDAGNLKAELNKTQSELSKLKLELSQSKNTAMSEAAEITTLRATLSGKDEELKNSQNELNLARMDLSKLTAELKLLESKLRTACDELESRQKQYEEINVNLKQTQNEMNAYQSECFRLNEEMYVARKELSDARKELNLTDETRFEMSTLESKITRLENAEKKLTELQLQITRLQDENDKLSSQLANTADIEKELKQLRDENQSLSSQLSAITERTVAESYENGIGEGKQKNYAGGTEHASLLTQKEEQVNVLRLELSQKEGELIKLNSQVDALKTETNKQCSLLKRLQDDLEAQRQKNNELRIKNWKVMEALSAAESRIKSNSGSNVDEITQRIKGEQETLTKAFLQRIFPEIQVFEKTYDAWAIAFEKEANALLLELRNRDSSTTDSDLQKQNEQLQGMVSHYKQIISDTENILNKLQEHIESEESRWQAQLQQKENDLMSLRIELSELRTAMSTDDKERARDSGELRNENSRNVNLNNEIDKLRSTVETMKHSLANEKTLTMQLQQELSKLKNELTDGCGTSEQLMLNGPQAANFSQSEAGSGGK